MDGLIITSPLYIKQNDVFVGGICLCICPFVRRPNVVRTLPLVGLVWRHFAPPPLVDWASRDFAVAELCAKELPPTTTTHPAILFQQTVHHPATLFFHPLAYYFPIEKQISHPPLFFSADKLSPHLCLKFSIVVFHLFHQVIPSETGMSQTKHFNCGCCVLKDYFIPHLFAILGYISSNCVTLIWCSTILSKNLRLLPFTVSHIAHLPSWLFFQVLNFAPFKFQPQLSNFLFLGCI